MVSKRNLLLGMALGLFFLAGCILRFSYGTTIEFKKDEAETLDFLLHFRSGAHGWPWLGQPSSSGLFHPGFGIWIFLLPGHLLGLTTPDALARVPQVLGALSLLLLLWFAFTKVRAEEREPWLWAYAIACVHPLVVLMDRKLWHPSVMPFFVLLLLIAWWQRRSPWKGAFLWGLWGALLGQIHLGGYYASLSLLLWTAAFDPLRKSIPWKHWLGGSFLGGLFLLPWLQAVWLSSGSEGVNMKWHRWISFRYWIYWVRDSFGWNSKYPLGQDLWDFYRYPLLGGSSTYLTALAHFVLMGLMVYFVILLLRRARPIRGLWQRATQYQTETRFLLCWGFFGCGALATLSAINITRYFQLTVFPLLYLFLAYILLRHGKHGRALLVVILVCQLFIAANFNYYVDNKTTSIRGDYGKPYSLSLPRSP